MISVIIVRDSDGQAIEQVSATSQEELALNITQRPSGTTVKIAPVGTDIDSLTPADLGNLETFQ